MRLACQSTIDIVTFAEVFWKTSRTTFQIHARIFVLLVINNLDVLLKSAVTIKSTVAM